MHRSSLISWPKFQWPIRHHGLQFLLKTPSGSSSREPFERVEAKVNSMTNDLKTYDLVVIGGGPAGITAATVASSFGKRVALADSHQEIGGAGINTGTVPR